VNPISAGPRFWRSLHLADRHHQVFQSTIARATPSIKHISSRALQMTASAERFWWPSCSELRERKSRRINIHSAKVPLANRTPTPPQPIAPLLEEYSQVTRVY